LLKFCVSNVSNVVVLPDRVSRPPIPHVPVERPLDLSPLLPLRRLAQLLIFGPKLGQRGRYRIDGSPLGQIDKFNAVILDVLLRQHEGALTLQVKVTPSTASRGQ
jgi:hypothetical protein